MKCPHCGALNKNGAKFCKSCGSSLSTESLAYQDKFGSKKDVSNSKSSGISRNILIVCVTVIILAIIVAGAYIYINSDDNADGNVVVNNDNQGSVNTQPTWHLVDSCTGSGSGFDYYSLPEGKLKVKISAFPIKNYATNSLCASSSTGDSVSVDWGSNSAVETRSDSMTFTSNGGDTLEIEYYETVNWKVEIYKYY